MLCTTAQGAQILVRFALRATVFELQPILVGGGGGGDNSETNVLNGESGYVQWYVLLARRSKFSSVLLYGSPFASYSQF